jgi:hypothetical protein
MLLTSAQVHEAFSAVTSQQRGKSTAESRTKVVLLRTLVLLRSE